MTSPHPAEHLAAAIRAGAAGLYALEAGCELLISTGWLHRDDFTRLIRTVTPAAAGTEVAEVDWQAVIASRDAGQLPCSGGENRVLRLAASIAAGIPVDLNHVSAASTTPASPASPAPSATPTAPAPTNTRTGDQVSYVTGPQGKHNTARHHHRKTPPPESAGPIATRNRCTRRVRKEGTPS
jgi:hypothetical protein